MGQCNCNETKGDEHRTEQFFLEGRTHSLTPAEALQLTVMRDLVTNMTEFNYKQSMGEISFNPLELEDRSVDYPDGGNYTGEWNPIKNGREGAGIYDHPSGIRFEGYWLDDKKSGPGREIILGKEVYEGYWLNDKRHGEGRLVSNDGREYSGNWENGFKEGRGVETGRDGLYFDGEFRQGLRHGHGTLRLLKGAV